MNKLINKNKNDVAMNSQTCHYKHDLCADPEDGSCHVTSHTCAMSKEWLTHLPQLLTIIPCLWQA